MLSIVRRLLSSASHSSLVELFIDGQSVKVPPNSAVIQACKAAGRDIPRFCYHERLAIAGNCRMCLVQIDKMPKMVTSCSQPVSAGMRVITDSPAVRKAREAVLEFLLANHPLDCPVCDQGGECDLQDQAMAFGSDRSRFRIDTQDKRAVADKYLGPLIKTSMNRCIHCTRCVRFANELAGVPDLGTTGRGSDMEIGTYVERTIKSELSGNIIDLCPVGALTSKPYAFQARPWELRKTESIDVMDAVGSAIRVDSRGMRVYRILPREKADINEEWLADKSRFACDALSLQRLTKPLVKDNGAFVESKWADALSLVAAKMLSARTKQAIVGDFADAESMCLTQLLFNSLGSENFSLDSDNPNVDLSNSSLTRMNAKISDFESADAILIIASNVRHEAPLLNLRIRKNYLSATTNVRIGFVGPAPPVSSTYEYEDLGKDFKDILKFKDVLKRATNPLILVSQAALPQCVDVLVKLYKDTGLTTGLCVLNRTASRAAALELGFSGPMIKDSDFTLLLNADNLHSSSSSSFNSKFTVYIGHHYEQGAQLANVILPGAAYTEKDALFMNIEGRLQSTATAVPIPGDARPDWAIIRALSEYCGKTIPLNTLESVRELVYSKLDCSLNQIKATKNLTILNDLEKFASHNNQQDDGRLFEYPISDYYLTDVISRLSPTMAACSREL